MPQGPLGDMKEAGSFGDSQQKAGGEEGMGLTSLSARFLWLHAHLGGSGFKQSGLTGQGDDIPGQCLCRCLACLNSLFESFPAFGIIFSVHFLIYTRFLIIPSARAVCPTLSIAGKDNFGTGRTKRKR